MSKLTLGTLFDGIGGFPLAAQAHNIEPVWASEIEKFPIAVTTKHFPNMQHLGDITKIDGSKITPVDIISFGSPCTRLSVAGKHDGFNITFTCKGIKDNPHPPYTKKIKATNKYQYFYTHICPICKTELTKTNESALFFHAIRIIGEMRYATNNKYPRFILWENVPGAFSSDKGQDFRAVLEEISESKISMPKFGRWANSGVVRGNGRSLAWRVLDAQYFGVPQRRKRIFLVADFGGQSAPEILFESKGMLGHLAESRKARENTASDVGDGTKTTGRNTRHGKSANIKNTPSIKLKTQNKPITFRDTTGTLRANAGAPKYESDWEQLICQPNPTKNTTVYALQGSMIGRQDKNGPQGDGVNEDVSFTLNTIDRHAVAYETKEISSMFTPSQFGQYKEGCGTLRASGGDCGGGSENLLIQDYSVRKLTPIEHLRLQGFPDWWFNDIPNYSDTAGYKSCGNSIALPCARWIMEKIAEIYKVKTFA